MCEYFSDSTSKTTETIPRLKQHAIVYLERRNLLRLLREQIDNKLMETPERAAIKVTGFRTEYSARQHHETVDLYCTRRPRIYVLYPKEEDNSTYSITIQNYPPQENK